MSDNKTKPLVKHARGEKLRYDKNLYRNVIYYCTDTREIIINDLVFGMSSDDKSMLNDLSANFDSKVVNALTAGKGISIDENGVVSTVLDVSLFTIVSKLPIGVNIDPNKIYLVKTSKGAKAGGMPDTGGQVDSDLDNPTNPDIVDAEEFAGNTYTEWIFLKDVERWEKLGEYKADISLDGYVTTEELAPLQRLLDAMNTQITANTADINTNRTNIAGLRTDMTTMQEIVDDLVDSQSWILADY